jgi:hypothetical protein
MIENIDTKEKCKEPAITLAVYALISTASCPQRPPNNRVIFLPNFSTNNCS